VRRLALALAAVVLAPGLALGAVERRQFTTTAGYLVIEVLDDDLVHFEASAIGSAPSLAQPLFTSPMVLKRDYGGPSTFVDGGQTLETPAIRLAVDTGSLCVRVEDKTRGNAHLTTICPVEMDKPFKGMTPVQRVPRRRLRAGSQLVRRRRQQEQPAEDAHGPSRLGRGPGPGPRS
jgi:alpha-glucosidase